MGEQENLVLPVIIEGMEKSAAQPAVENPEKRSSVATLGPMADSLSKGIAAIAIALYASGFLIISLHHSRYGFVSTDPFRPRILAAGAWFLFMTAIPVFGVTKLRGTTALKSWVSLAEFSYPYYFGCLFLSVLATPFFSFSGISQWPAAAPTRWYWSVDAGFLGLALCPKGMEEVFCNRFSCRVSPARSLLLAISRSRSSGRIYRFEENAIVLWFVGVWAITVFEAKIRPRAGDWEKTAFLVLGALFVFALFYYPHIKSSWGGGTPVPATIYFAKDSPIRPSQAVSVQLIEESDQGFYIVAPNEPRALFVPRNSVSLQAIS